MQTVFITGVSDGIGAALATYYAAAGARLGLGGVLSRIPLPASCRLQTTAGQTWRALKRPWLRATFCAGEA